jgi:hypothetical protein
VAVSKVRRRVQAFVNELDYKALRAAFEDGQTLPTCPLELDGLEVLIEVIPKNVRGSGGHAVGVQVFPTRAINPHLAIKTAIEGKAGRYGELDLPYVVAVNAFDQFARPESVVDALFGTEGVAATEDGRLRQFRNPDGVWRGAGGPVYRRVSAVLSTERLGLWDLGQRSMRLIANPWAARPLPEISLGIEVRKVLDDRLVLIPGVALGEILGLPTGWPE